MREDIHGGHRERLIRKFTDYPDSFSDHELLEMLLFAVLPRKDTNAIAHRLINAFGSLKNVFGANAEQLTTVDGVGEKVAAYIVLHARLMEKLAATVSEEQSSSLSNLGAVKTELSALFRGLKGERFYLLLLDGKFRSVFRLQFSGNSFSEVFADLTEAARALTLHKAHFAIIAHNHPSGNCLPSEADDDATRKFFMLCELHGVRLADHIIFSGETCDNAFSYFQSGRLTEIRYEAESVGATVSGKTALKKRTPFSPVN